MKWWQIPLFYLAIAIAGYVWGMFTTLGKNDTLKRKKGRNVSSK